VKNDLPGTKLLDFVWNQLCDLIEITDYSDEIPPSLSEQLSEVFNDILYGDLKNQIQK
jgi:hypothetical protein